MPLSNLFSSESLPANLPPAAAAVLTVHCEDRWQVYHRLQELGINAQCKSFQPLQANINTPTEVLQLWSVIRQVSTPRHVLAAVLHKSWQLEPFVCD